MRRSIVCRQFLFDNVPPGYQCHGSCLTALPNGSMLAAWFDGVDENVTDVAIRTSRFDGTRWGSPEIAVSRGPTPCWNPVLFQDQSSRLWLFYKTGNNATFEGGNIGYYSSHNVFCEWQTWIAQSTDGGASWQGHRELVPGDVGGRGPVKNKPLITPDGLWVAPNAIDGSPWQIFADLSEDCGHSWQKSATVDLPDRDFGGPGLIKPVMWEYRHLYSRMTLTTTRVIQPALWSTSPGLLHMLMRSNDRHLYRSDSADGGRTWTAASRTGLEDNNMALDLARMEDGTLVLAYNPANLEVGANTKLCLLFSKDNGKTWGDEVVLEDSPGEYSYPSVVAMEDTVCVTYTWKRERIAFCAVKVRQ